MNIDPKLIDQALGALPYPVGKDNVVQMARQFGANDQIMGMLEKLPDMQFNSAEEVKSHLGGFGNLGNLGNLGGFFNR